MAQRPPWLSHWFSRDQRRDHSGQIWSHHHWCVSIYDPNSLISCLQDLALLIGRAEIDIVTMTVHVCYVHEYFANLMHLSNCYSIMKTYYPKITSHWINKHIIWYGVVVLIFYRSWYLSIYLILREPMFAGVWWNMEGTHWTLQREAVHCWREKLP